jgi:hypothetical protein
MFLPLGSLLLLCSQQLAPAQSPQSVGPAKADVDWLIQAPAIKADVVQSADGRELTMSNGLIARTWRLVPNAACVAFDNLLTGKSMLRSVRPEARITLNGVAYDVGGLVGQPNHAFLTPEWLEAMAADPKSMQLVGYEIGEPKERLKWKQVRHHAPDAVWPPEGVALRFDYQLPHVHPVELAEEKFHEVLFEADFSKVDDGWKVHQSSAHARSSFENEGKWGEIYTPANTAVFAEHELPEQTEMVAATFSLGTDRSASWGPGLALVFENKVIKFHIRPGGDSYSGKPQLGLWDGQQERPNLKHRWPMATDVAWTLRIRLAADRYYFDAKPENGEWKTFADLPRVATDGKPSAVRVGKMDKFGGNGDFSEAGDLVRLKVENFVCYGELMAGALQAQKYRIEQQSGITISLHYEMYDGIPVMAKWLTIDNQAEMELELDRFTLEELAVVEHANWVESRDGVTIPRPDYLHVETDFSFGGFQSANANRHVVHWREDPIYSTQVNYLRKTPCLLVVEPTYGPAQTIEPNDQFQSFHVFELAYDSSDRERKGLALRRMYRTIAPWVTENPLMHHLLANKPDVIRKAIDQAVDVGFEMIILSFGSGFNIESEDPAYIQQWKDIADYAGSKGIDIGGYSLLSSRRIGGGNDVVSPEGQRPTHGNCPALTSKWGLNYFTKLYNFYETTGMDLLEHDGSYPGDVDVTERPPLQKGEKDSRWVQWTIISSFYQWCREQGIYLNVPDYYYLSGTNKCGMGYREVNWSLPRAHQLIHTRQNIYDGTWRKTPSMGWMFVPLTQYHGGGAAATIEPLNEHLDHYRGMLLGNLGLGVQACYRGPRLYDTDRTRDMLKAQITWFKKYRDILESDVIHGRRADGRDLDWMLHVNPQLADKGMLVVYNPLQTEVRKTINVNLYYTGLTDVAKVSTAARSSFADGAGDETSTLEAPAIPHQLARDYSINLDVTVPAGGMRWFVIR